MKNSENKCMNVSEAVPDADSQSWITNFKVKSRLQICLMTMAGSKFLLIYEMNDSYFMRYA